jgi:glycosyltransferase involved in cell wall biosynthesis
LTAPHTSVVVPVYDNEATLDELLDRLVRALESLGRSFEVILVDDGSRDGSLALLRRRAAVDPRLRVLALARNFGGQSAICAGFDHVRGRFVVCLDADLENLPEDVPALMAPLDAGADLVCGVRERRRSPWLRRRLPSALLNAYVRSRLERSVRDIGCGMRAMDARLVRNVAAEGEWRRFLTPLLLRRARRVVEVPVRHQPSPARGGHSFWTLLGIAGDFVLVTAGRPFLVTGLAALGLAGAGALALAGGALAGRGGLARAGVALLAAGFVGGVASLAGEYAQRAWELLQGRPYYVLRELDPPAHEAPRAPDGDAPRDAG